ncbi:putative serine/threonine-protein kinase kinX [Termitomyces sp. T112]|nr:putative serine/threonine-protein kinase kinX [Termitomyces sp. T112]
MVCYELFTYPPLANMKTMSISSAHSKIAQTSSRDSFLGFLAGQTGWHPSSNLDTGILSCASACKSTVDTSCISRLGPEVGPQVTDICNSLLNVFNNHKKYTEFLKCGDEAAEDLLDILQKLLDHAPLMPEFRKILYVALVRLCRKSELCPRSFKLEGVTDRSGEAQSRGTFGDVYQACYDRNPVCLKAVKVYKENLSAEEFERRKVLTRKAFSREAVVWGQLLHANILPFYGICFLNEELHLVSPLVPKGNVWQFFNEPERLEADRTHLISGVSAGMEYLHQNGVAHGDLKCLNVLVAEPEQALLADFGFSYVTDNNGLQHWSLSSSHQAGGTLVFEAPERVSSEFTKRRDEASDVFAFGMLCYEMFILPQSKKIETIHGQLVYASKLPKRPVINATRGLTDDMWALIERCLSPEPKRRPKAKEIKHGLPSSSGRDRILNRRIRPGFEQVNDATIKKAYKHLRAL